MARWASSPPPGLERPDVSVPSEEFLTGVRGVQWRKPALDLLEKLLKGELSTRRCRTRSLPSTTPLAPTTAVQVLGGETAAHRSRAGRDRAGQRDHRPDAAGTVRAKLRVLVKLVLRKYGYPPDKQESATRTELEQAEVLSARWAT